MSDDEFIRPFQSSSRNSKKIQRENKTRIANRSLYKNEKFNRNKNNLKNFRGEK
jgi:hypothetical protein